MIYTKEVQQMCCVAKGANHANAPIPEEGKWVHAKEIKDISVYIIQRISMISVSSHAAQSEKNQRL